MRAVTYLFVFACLLSINVLAGESKFVPAELQGSYTARISCQQGDKSPFCKNYEAFNLENSPLRLIVLSNLERTTMVLYHLDEKNPFYHFTVSHHGEDENEIFANSSPGFSRTTPEMVLRFEADREGKKATGKGWIRDTYMPSDMRIEVRQRSGVISFAKSEKLLANPFSLATVIGDYKGTLEGPDHSTNFSLRIRRSGIDNDMLIASSFPSNGNTVYPPVDFTVSVFDGWNGKLFLMGKFDLRANKTNTNEETQYVFRINEDANGTITLTGAAVYSNATGYHRLKFTKR